ncbi:MAG: right-handed parallel beta-helix repeat-containing protein [Candidatus Bathyarchaeota archaeon]|nr:right-handed parallel beta-helix repeat-containing protein [Candidatus Bathyarchaeota archaeon]
MVKRQVAIVCILAFFLVGSGMPLVSQVNANFVEPPPEPGTVGTIYITPDGKIEPSNASVIRNGDIYTLTGNIGNFSIEVQRNNVVIDGAGFTLLRDSIWAPNTGIVLNGRINVTVQNLVINNFRTGIYLTNSRNSSVISNSLNSNQQDIQLNGSCSNIISGNNMESAHCGILISDGSLNNSILSNTITVEDEGGYGISLSSGNNTLRQNRIRSGNGLGFDINLERITGLSDYANDIDMSNTVDAKSVCYWVNQQDKTVPYGCGFVALINCANIKVENLNLTGNRHGLLFVSTNNTQITGNTIAHNSVGIAAYESTENSFANNTLSDNAYGIQVFSFGNKFTGNQLSNNGLDVNFESGFIKEFDYSNTANGKPICFWINQHNRTVPTYIGYVVLFNCSNITIENLDVTGRVQGIFLVATTNSTITNNVITNNDVGIYLLDSSNNTISRNELTGNQIALNATRSNQTVIFGNKFSSDEDGIYLKESSFSLIQNNYLINSRNAINLVSCWYSTITENRAENASTPLGMFDSGYNNVTKNHFESLMMFPINCYSSIGIGNNRFVQNNLVCGSDLWLGYVSEKAIYHSGAPFNWWDDGEKGNYWNDYLTRYPQATENGNTGTGTRGYLLNSVNIDHHPLLEPIEQPNLAEVANLHITLPPPTPIDLNEYPSPDATSTPSETPNTTATPQQTQQPPTNTPKPEGTPSPETSETPEPQNSNTSSLAEYLYLVTASVAVFSIATAAFMLKKRSSNENQPKTAGETI